MSADVQVAIVENFHARRVARRTGVPVAAGRVQVPSGAAGPAGLNIEQQDKRGQKLGRECDFNDARQRTQVGFGCLFFHGLFWFVRRDARFVFSFVRAKRICLHSFQKEKAHGIAKKMRKTEEKESAWQAI